MIFSMNSTGKALTQADLIRNFVLMIITHEDRPNSAMTIGVQFFSAGKLQQAFRRIRSLPGDSHWNVSARTMSTTRSRLLSGRDDETLLAALLRLRGITAAMTLSKKDPPTGSNVSRHPRDLRADVCYPMLMEIYHDYELHLLTGKFVRSYSLRAMCFAGPFAIYRPTPTTDLCGNVSSRRLKKSSVPKASSHLSCSSASYRRFPKDDEFMRQLQTRNLYKFNRGFWLRRFEASGAKSG